MEATVVGAVIGATIQVVLQQLITLPLDRIKDFKKDLENLKSSFDMLNDVLYHADLQHVTDRPLKRWMRNLEDLAFEADNVLDEINYQLLPKKMEITQTQTKTKNKVISFFSPSKNPIANCLRLAAQIREINKKLDLSNQQATAFGLQARLAVGVRPPDFGSTSSSMETNSFSVDPIFIGRENDVSRIVEMLITTSSTEKVLSVLPIVGMGGLGKTTLAKKVFHDQQIVSHFGEYRVWVHVSQNFDVSNILKNILTSLPGETIALGTNEALLKKLQNIMGDKRYLLVLDDNWSRETEMWSEFVNSLLGISSVAGSCMIVTTRSQDVASIVGTLPSHELQGLTEDDCWSIIKSKAFGEGNIIPIEFEALGKHIAIRCQGLPLAAKVVGGILCGKSKDEWLSIEKTRLSNFGDGDSINKILKLSFDNLWLPSLKKCFAYCSMFPKGDKIEKEQLIQLWMAEGFLQTNQNISNMETTGGKFFDLLLQNSLLQVTERHSTYGYVTHCNMHDLVHDLACSILEGERNNDGICQSRYVGYNSSGRVGSLSITKEHRRYLRTLFFNGKVGDIMFSDFKSLHSLTLMGGDILDLPSSIGNLIHLRYLDISKTRVKCLPDSVGELYHLQTLRARTNDLWEECSLGKLPDSLKYCISLRHLHIHYKTMLPSEIGRLTSLQTLPCYCVRKEKGFGISELRSLNNLRGRLEIHNLENVLDKREAASADLFRKSDIYQIMFKWNEGDREGEENDESVLQGLEPHSNIKSLKICGFNGKSIPQWTSKMEGFNNLSEIKLEKCRQVEELPMLGHLPHLKSLKISHLENVRSIGSSFYNIDNCSSISSSISNTIVVFPALERLELSGMSNLREWAQVEIIPAVVFPRLEYMKVEGCTQLECLPDGVFANNHNLLKLKISKCLNLRGLPDGLHTLSSLEILRIEECPNLKSIAAKRDSNNIDESHNNKCFFSTSLLRELVIINCEGLIHLPIEMVESCAPSLEILWLHGLNSLTNIPMVIGCLHKMTRLRELTIREVPKFSRIEIGSLGSSSLQYLEMGCWRSDDNNVSSSSFNEVMDAVLQTSRVSLGWLSLRGMSHWDCLPDQIQHLTSLCELYLYNYGMEALAEWFGNLESLELLELNNCTKLRHLPSKEAMQLTKLTDLNITKCPLLLKERHEETPQIVDSEWHKISHIPYIIVDGFVLN